MCVCCDVEAQLCAGTVTESRLAAAVEAEREETGMREERGRALSSFLSPSHYDDDS